MSDQHPAASDWAEWWPGGHDRWISQAMSIEQLVQAAFLAGWDARNSRLRAMAFTPGAYPQATMPRFPQHVPGAQMPESGPPPVLNLADYANSKDFGPPAGPVGYTPGQFGGRSDLGLAPDPAETGGLPVIRAAADPQEAAFNRLNAAWTEEYGPVGPVPTIPGLKGDENG